MNEKEGFKELETINSALAKFYSSFHPSPKKEVVNLGKASNRVLAEDVFSNIGVPQFDRAKMDGWAVKASDIEKASETNPITLEVVGSVPIGKKPSIRVDHGEAARIGTGAMIPPGANAVIMVEYTERKNHQVRMFSAVAPGENIQERGSDIMLGEGMLKKGDVISSREVAVLAAIGKEKVTVFKKPKVGILSIGNELTKPGKKLEFGKIYDINTYSLLSSVKASGGNPTFWRKLGDDEPSVKSAIMKAITKTDLVLTSGATSMGSGDFIPQLIENLDQGEVLVHGLKFKPGKPTVIGIINDTPYFGLPGHPVSCLTIFRELVEPLIKKMAALPTSKKKQIEAILKARIPAPKGRKYFASLSLNKHQGKIVATPVPGGSGTITNLLRADAYVPIPSEKEYQPKNTQIKATLLSENLQIPDLTIATSFSSIIHLLQKQVYRTHPNLRIKIIKSGNIRTIIGVKRGEYSIGAISLFDKKDPDSAMTSLSDIDPEGELSLVSGIYEEIGIVFNPKRCEIRSLKDLIKKSPTFMNRKANSAARELFQKKISQTAFSLEGRQTEQCITKLREGATGSSNLAIALAVDKKEVNAGLSSKYFARRLNLGFLSIGKVPIDFLFHKTSSQNKKLLFTILLSKEFKELVKNYTGVQLKKNVGKILK